MLWYYTVKWWCNQLQTFSHICKKAKQSHETKGLQGEALAKL